MNRKECYKKSNKYVLLTVLLLAMLFSINWNRGAILKAASYDGDGWYIRNDILYITSQVAFNNKGWTSHKGDFRAVNYSDTSDIPNSAFEGCSNIENFTFGLYPSSIGNKAFYNCTGLYNITIPSYVSSIGTSAFEGCTRLQAYFDQGNETLSIGNRAFYGCSSFLDIGLPNRVYVIGDSAFENIPFSYVTIPNNIGKIGDKAFYYSSPGRSSEIVWGKGIRSVGKNVVCDSNRVKVSYSDDIACNYFADYKNIIKNDLRYPSTFTDGNGIIYKRVGEKSYAISGFTSKIKSDLTIPVRANGFLINHILEGAFKTCTGLTSLTIPDYFQIDKEAFRDCTKLKSISIGAGTKLEEDTFRGCTYLENVTVGAWCKLGKNTFSDAGMLKKVDFQGELSEIGEGAFRNCKSLTSIKVPEGVKVLEKAVFSGCSSLKNIGLPKSLNKVLNTYDEVYGGENYAFYQVPQKLNVFCYANTDAQFIAESFGFTCHLYYDFAYWFDEDGTYYVTGISDLASKVVIPKEVEGIAITRIEKNASAYKENLESIELEGNTDIEEGAFAYCTNLKSVTLPGGLHCIEARAFKGCTSLTSVKIPANISFMKEEIFADCKNLRDIIIEGSVISIVMGDKGSFKGIAGDAVFTCRSYSPATKVLKENGYQVIEVDDLKFTVNKLKNVYIYQLNNLETLNIPETVAGMRVELIYSSALKDKTKLKYLKIGAGITIEPGAFEGCTALEEVYIGDDCIIEDSAFEGCTSLRKIVIGNGCTIGRRMCSLDTKLTDVEFEGSVKGFAGSVFSNCSALEKIILPEGMSELACDTFIYCDSLKEVVMPSSLRSIGMYYGKPTLFVSYRAVFYFKQFNILSGIMQDNGYHCELLG